MSGIVTARTIDSILEKVYLQSGLLHRSTSIQSLGLDLSRVEVVRPGGAVGLVCLCSAFMANRLEGLASPSRVDLRMPSQSVTGYLARIGFFTEMSLHADLSGHNDLVSVEEEWRRRDKIRGTQSDMSEGSHRENRSLVWPMHSIGHKGERYTRQDFEARCQHLTNEVSGQLGELFASRQFNFDKAAEHHFLSAISELFLNVYDHSNSWGLTMIHARPRWGTFMCCYDIGVGVRGSVSASPNCVEGVDSDYEAIKWALVEGRSARVGGNGLGLNIVDDFVSSKKGIYDIRSGTCRLQKTPKAPAWKPLDVPWFPGTQISIFVPV